MTMNCEQCNDAISAASAVYTSAGKLLCPSCLTAAQIVEADALGVAARRKVKVALAVTVALLVIVPGAMFVAGLGEVVGYTLMGLGGLSGMGASTVLRGKVIRNVDPMVKRSALYLLLGGMAVCFLGIIIVAMTHGPRSLPAPHRSAGLAVPIPAKNIANSYR